MSVDAIILAMLLFFVLLAFVPAFVAWRSKVLYATDIGLMFLPTVGFVSALVLLNKPAQTGWAVTLVVPILALSVVLLYVRVFALNRLARFSAKQASYVCFLIAFIAATLLGAFAPPWYN